MGGNSSPLSWERAYPAVLKQIEKNLLAQRRALPQGAEIPNQVGFALSGGGIRSATFCLGIFQGLGKQSLLKKIDYLSTVSGGGYFGSFYGRLFTRPQVAGFTDVQEILAACSASDVQDSPPESPPGSPPAPKKFPIGKVFRWLRDNGRYLAPRGAGGILLDSAVMMRNWAALQVVLAILMLMVFLAVQLIRGIVEVTWRGTGWGWRYENFLVHPPWGTHIWWSPYAIAPALAFVILVVPPAWSYWLVGKPDHHDVPGWCRVPQWIPPKVGLASAAVLAFAGMDWGIFPNFCLVVFALSVLTAAWFFITAVWLLVNELYVTRAGNDGEILSPEDREIRNSEEMRNHLSVQLKYGLILTGCLLGFVVLDSLAQTIYAAYVANPVSTHRLEAWTASIFGMLTAAAGFGRSIFVALGSKADGKRISVPWSAAAGIAAVLVVAVLLVTFDVCSYAIAWQGLLPMEALPQWVQAAKPEPGKLFKIVQQAPGNYLVKRIPAATGKPETVFNVVKQLPKNQAGETWAVQSPPVLEENKKDETKKNDAPKQGSRADANTLHQLEEALFAAFVFSFLFGWSWPFLNRSTLHPLYTSRLIRAYLGASNPRRLLGTKGGDVTEVVAGDDLKQEQYWALHPPGAQRGFFDSIKARFRRKGSENKQGTIAPGIYAKGGPLHLVNVTINETAGGRSAVEQLDRKGVGMAIGPAAISAGVCHHVVFERKDGQPPVKVYPELSEKNAFRMFGDADSFQGERLSLGNWMGVSGAAISTGLGSRTSLGASFLAGWANIRLGYWWNSGVDPKMRNQAAPSSLLGQVSVKAANWVASVFSMQAFFAMQTFLLNEFSARFYGPACQWWYLTDGGHFENMGGYELIRRRLPIMVIVDAEADPDYSFEGMANLVRKARLDFGAEIEFLSEESLDTFVDVSLRGYFGTPEQLRRGRWVEEPVEVPGAPPRDPGKQRPKRRVINPPDEAALSRAYASLAVVSYTDHAAPNSLLLYVKPTLIGAEPVDVRRYHTENPSFPQETTAEQFFNEAQWESYRKLGEHIAGTLFAHPQNGAAAPKEKFTPRLALNGSIPWEVLRTFVQG